MQDTDPRGGSATVAAEGDPLRAAVTAEARQIGFADVGITTPGAIASAGLALRDWVAAGHHGQMGWMEDRLDWRADPRTLWPEARSVIMLAEPYTPAHDPLAVLDLRDRATISVYAQNRDYHDLVKKR